MPRNIMDFSNGDAALSSLNARRRPSFSPEVISLASSILSSRKSGVGDVLRDAALLLSHHTSEPGAEATSDDADAGMKRWEILSVGLVLADEHLVRFLRPVPGTTAPYADGPRVPDLIADGTSEYAPPSPEALRSAATFLEESMVPALLANAEHDEPRVRTLVARAMGTHSLLASSDLDPLREVARAQRLVIHGAVAATLRREVTTGRIEKPVASVLPDAGGKHALDDTTGWRATETSLLSIAAVVGGWGGRYTEDVGKELMEVPKDGEGKGMSILGLLDHCVCEHRNRHVRAAALQCLEQIVRDVRVFASNSGNEVSLHLLDGAPLRSCLEKALVSSLVDNWSQVRMAGSVLAREVLVRALGSSKKAKRRKMFPALLPMLCMNRFYLAQGVKIYSKETWRLMFCDEGQSTGTGMREVAAQAGKIVKYYAAMCDADNHVVREAACQAIAELAIRIGPDEVLAPYLAPHVSTLLRALLLCFQDESWPVRDEACIACGIFAKAYPDLCRPDLEQLYGLWFDHLRDPIWSVREDAASALSDAMTAYGSDAVSRCVAEAKSLLPCARDQPAQTYEEMVASHNDAALHTDTQLYSCGSLAPKLHKSANRVAGCSDCRVLRDAYPWEKTDGAIYMIRELCGDGRVGDGELLPMMEELADVCRVRHFPKANDLRATLWKALPIMAEKMGKRRFKAMYLEVFLDLLFRSLDWARMGDDACNRGAQFAAERCAQDLAAFVGPRIFQGRLEDWMVPLYEQCALAASNKEPQCPLGLGPRATMIPPVPIPGGIGRFPY